MPSNELTVDEWFEEINRGLEFRKLYGMEASWAENEALFYNSAPGNVHAGPNIVYSNGDALMSAMNVPYPYITQKPRRQEFITASRLRELVDNELVDDLHVCEEADPTVLSAYIFGKGICKIGYDSEFGWDPSMDYGLIQQQPLGLTLTQFSKNQQRIEFGGVQPGMPWIKNVLPHDFVVPWGVRKLDHAPWVAHRVVRHLDDCKADPKYKTKGLRPVMSDKDFVESYKKVPQVYRVGEDITRGYSWGDSTGDQEYVELWEIHDRRTGKIFVIATGYDKFLRNERDYLQLAGGLPFVEFSLVPSVRNFWTTSDAQYLKAIQNEASDIALQKARHRRISNLKFLYDSDILDEIAIEKFLDDEIGAAIPVKGGGEDIRNRIAAFVPPPQYQFGVDEEANRRDGRELIGFSRNQMGEFEQSGRRTATEAQVVQQASNLRMDRRQSGLAKFYTNVFKKINPIIETYWQVPKWVELAGEDGAMHLVPFAGSDLKGEFRASTGFSLAPQETLQQRRMNALQLFMSLGQNPLINPFAAARYLNSNYNDPEFTTIFQPGVLDGSLEMLAARGGLSPADGGKGGAGNGNGMGGSPSGTKGASGQGKQTTSAGANRSSTVQTSGSGTY